MNEQLIPIGKKAVLGGSKQKLYALLEEMDTKLQTEKSSSIHQKQFLCGDSITVADCCLFPFLWRIDQEYGIDNYKSLQTWLNTCKNEESFQKTIQRAWWWWW